MKKLNKENSIVDYRDYVIKFKELDKLTKDELIERYLYKSEVGGKIIVSLVLVSFVLIIGLFITISYLITVGG